MVTNILIIEWVPLTFLLAGVYWRMA